ncbi:hypothetical protein A1O3_02505 [Capronia epimyces CBS 606.96]|uniref:Uncharacterized protein n=1 Tax=Capronia epimyces CBS 606.96 TaxID=1182542 RepID=W9YAB6_9EURO|nr:uncharacterized protein A1O3_02505 [Capronia epimyces CBS 606.96]EXJ89438.1 hypothetical protein A1O3_02505 [Capronia epimyces CBS 606.96]
MTSDTRFRHERDTAAALDLMSRGADYIKGDNLSRYVDLFKVVRDQVYSSSARQGSEPTNINPLPPSGDNMDTIPETTVDNEELFPFLDGQDFDSYINQVTGYFADSATEMDHVLTAWYGSILSETQ